MKTKLLLTSILVLMLNVVLAKSESNSYLKNTLELLQLIHSKEKFSLGLHPFIYFYSNIGRKRQVKC